MQLKDATRIFGRLGLLLPLTLIFLMAADSAYACPEHTSKALYRTKTIKARTVSHMPTTVISYRAPAAYKRCGSSLYDTRGAKYVAVRGNGTRYVAIRGSGARYVAVRNDDGFSLGRKRYGAVYDVDYGIPARRYVAVNRDPVYVANGTRYVPVRLHTPQTRYVAVRRIDIDDDDDVRYVAVRRVVPRTRYIAIRNIDIDDDDAPRYIAVRSNAPRTRYVAVRDIDTGCTRAVALRSCLDQIETTSVKHVVLRDDDDDSDYSKLVALRDESDDEYIAVARNTPKYVEYRDATYTAANDFDDTCLRNVAVRTCRPDAVSTRTITYEVPDLDDQAFLHDDDARYIAADDMEDACLPRRVVGGSPAVVTSRTVSYIQAEYVDEDVSLVRSEPTYVENEHAVAQPRYVALDDDRVFDDLDPTWVAEVGETTAAAFGYVPVNDVAEIGAESVSYMPADEVEVAPVSYVPVDDMRLKTVSYVPVESADEVDTTFIAADDCPTLVSKVSAEPVYSTVLVEEVDSDLVADLRGTQQIAGGFGYRDGFEDGQEAALEGDLYHPENSGDFKKATEGYEDEFGDKDVYKDSYRTSYLAGYRAGFQSGSSV